MRTLIVLIPEGYFVEYYVYSLEEDPAPYSAIGGVPPEGCTLEWNGRIRFRGEGASGGDIGKLIGKYSPEAVAVRVLYGGREFGRTQICDNQILKRLASLVTESPLHIPAAIKLIKTLGRIVPTPDIILFFETSFFVSLPLREQSYSIDSGLQESYGDVLGNVRRYGYHGLYHDAAVRKMRREGARWRKVISICLEPVPEVVGIFDGRPVSVSGGATPLEGLPGNTTSGEIDPGVVLLLEEKKKWGPETINEMLSTRSGLSAVAGEKVTLPDVIGGRNMFAHARELIEYRILLSCGSAAAAMDGVDAIAFSGRYVEAADRIADWLVPRLAMASAEKARPDLFVMREPLHSIIAETYSRSRLVPPRV